MSNPSTEERLASARDEARRPTWIFLKRVAELGLATALAAIAILTLWLSYDSVVRRTETSPDTFTLWSIVYILTFLSVVGLLFAARLAIPRLRLKGDRIVSHRGLWAFGLVYAAVIANALWRGLPGAKLALMWLAWGIAIGYAVRDTRRTWRS